jgi:anti-anti-sigma factor
MPLKHYTDRDDTVISVSGKFNEDLSMLVERKLEDIFVAEELPQSLRLDLGGADYITSAGIRVLIIAYKKGIKNDIPVKLHPVSDKVRQMLEMVGVIPLFSKASGGRGADVESV